MKEPRMDRSICKLQTFEEAESCKIFSVHTSLQERIQQCWILTCRAYGYDPENPPRMDKSISSVRKHSH